MDGSAALPRRNGHLVFDAPWQGRAFGLALGIVEHLGTGWEPFRSRLIEVIARHPERPYWESWVVATELFATEHGLLDEVAPGAHPR